MRLAGPEGFDDAQRDSMTQTEAGPAHTGAGLAPLDTSREGWSLDIMMDPDFAREPQPYFDLLRQQGCPLRDEFRMPGKAPTVIVARGQDVDVALRNPALFSSEFGEGVAGIGNDRPLIPLQIDPPEHKKYRVLLDPYFSPRQMALLEEEVAVLVNSLIDEFIEAGTCEFMSQFAVPLPCTVFLRLMGLPLEDLDLFLRIKEGIIRGDLADTYAGQVEARQRAGRECYEYFEAALDRLSVEPVDGLLCDLLEAEVDGLRLTREEILDICFLFIIAGLDTVTDSLCCFFSYLATHPGDRARLVSDPAVIPAAVEELLRWESPVSGVARIAAEDTEISGCPVHKGDSLLVFVGAANIDPDAVDRPGEVDFDRAVNRHHAFGGGIHRCLGSHLARMELRVAMREWHRRLPDYRIEEGAELVWTPMLRAVQEMPLILSA
jgi:cytochrome P450